MSTSGLSLSPHRTRLLCHWKFVGIFCLFVLMAPGLLCICCGVRRNPKPHISALLDWGGVREMNLGLEVP